MIHKELVDELKALRKEADELYSRFCKIRIECNYHDNGTCWMESKLHDCNILLCPLPFIDYEH